MVYLKYPLHPPFSLQFLSCLSLSLHPSTSVPTPHNEAAVAISIAYLTPKSSRRVTRKIAYWTRRWDADWTRRWDADLSRWWRRLSSLRSKVEAELSKIYAIILKISYLQSDAFNRRHGFPWLTSVENEEGSSIERATSSLSSSATRSDPNSHLISFFFFSFCFVNSSNLWWIIWLVLEWWMEKYQMKWNHTDCFSFFCQSVFVNLVNYSYC